MTANGYKYVEFPTEIPPAHYRVTYAASDFERLRLAAECGCNELPYDDFATFEDALEVAAGDPEAIHIKNLDTGQIVTFGRA